MLAVLLFWRARIRKDLPCMEGPTKDTNEGYWILSWLSLAGKSGNARLPNLNCCFDVLNSMKQFDLSFLNLSGGINICSLGSLR